ncbi:MAG TPA: WD40 repeat domain-containing protein [Armatimonadota bacterium]|nr:WD40 repeat domain-containing protein [Armatimonadota bacterium]
MISGGSLRKLAGAIRDSLASAGSLLLILLLAASQSAHAGDRESITIKWKTPASQPVCLAMSAAGRFFGTVAKDGTVRLYGRNGSQLWEQRVEGATDVLIARNAQSVLVYSKLNPMQRAVYFFRNDGQRLWRHEVEGSVWSASVSPDGNYAAVTSGEGRIYVYKPDPRRPTYRRWRLDGIGYRVVFSADSRRVIVGTSQESALVCYDIRGRFQWRCRHDTDRQYELCASADGRRILGVLPATQHDPGIEFCLWDSGGKRLWKRSLDSFDARALISPKSQYVAISYASFLSHEGSGIIEQKVAVYRCDGQLLWDKGGLFFSPYLVALSPKGSSVIVSDGDRSLYNIDKHGKLLSKLTLRGTLRKTISSEDGRRILAYCGDGWLYLMQVG